MRGTNDPENNGIPSQARDDTVRASIASEVVAEHEVRRSRELWDQASAEIFAAIERVIRQSVAEVLEQSRSPERQLREDTRALRELLLQERSQLLTELDDVRREAESLRREVLQAREDLAEIMRLRISAEETVQALLRDAENLRSQWCAKCAPLEQPPAEVAHGSTDRDNRPVPEVAVLPDAPDRGPIASSERAVQEATPDEGDSSGPTRSATISVDRTPSSDKRSSSSSITGPKPGLATATTSPTTATGSTVETEVKPEPDRYSPLVVPRSSLVPISTAPDFTALDALLPRSSGSSPTVIIRAASELLDAAVAEGPVVSDLDLTDPRGIRALVAMADEREGYDRGHSERVRAYAVATARELLLHERQIATLESAALLRDIGFIHIPAQIMMKSGPLSKEEWELIRRHPTLGVSIIKALPRMEAIVPIVLQHHERYDGRGYPMGLPGSDTHILAQILSIAEAYAAMTSRRPYRPSLTSEQAVAELRKGAGSQFNPILVEVFVKTTRDLALRDESSS